MTTIKTAVINGWYYEVKKTGRVDKDEYYAIVRETLTECRLDNFEDEDDADSLIANWGVQEGVLVSKADTERYGYYSNPDTAEHLAKRYIYSREYLTSASLNKVGRFLEHFGKQAMLLM